MSPSEIDCIPDILSRLYQIVHELEARFPGRRFTPDGHLVGSLGEVLASYHYNLELLPGSTECHDAKATDGRLVQIKATQGNSIDLNAEPYHLIALKILPDGRVEELFNGPGSLAWNAAGKLQKNGQRSVGASKLRKLMTNVPEEARLKRRDLQLETAANVGRSASAGH